MVNNSIGKTYTEFSVNVHYVTDNGSLQLPTAAADGAEAKIVKLYAKTEKKIIFWIATAIGGCPQILDPTPSDPSNEKLLFTDFGVPVPSYSPNGERIFTLTGTYVYALSRPRNVTDSISFGGMPGDGEVREVFNPSRDYLSQKTYYGK